MRKRRQIELFSISFLDLSGALGAVIILFVAMPKSKSPEVSVRVSESQSMVEQLKKTEEELAKAKALLSQASEQLAKLEKTSVEGGKDLDIGFKFKGKEILFIIDTSYSMTEEDRMGQVKAGLKMLITSLGKDYKVEVIRYPFDARAPFKTLWGVARENTASNQMDIFDFVYRLQPFGGTPTRDVLLFALRNYEDISDIVLLTDGAPTFHNSNKKDDIYDILRVVRTENTRKVQINCIGVGAEFTKDKTNDRYQFLSLLSQEGNGFFVGF